jgi:hypothetical protein
MAGRIQVSQMSDLAEQWEGAVADANDEGNPNTETDLATAQSLTIMSEIAQTPAANMTDVAVKIGIVAHDLRLHAGERLLALLLESAEQDCLRIAADAVPANA